MGFSGSTFIKINDQLFATGYNRSNELGLGDGINRTSFTPIRLPVNISIKKVACGGDHTFILDNTGKLFATGHNRFGQLGLGDRINRTSFTHVQLPYNIGPIVQVASGYYHTFILDNTGKLFATGSNINGQLGLGDGINRTSFTPIRLPDNSDTIKQVACGESHTFILDNTGKLFAAGLNEEGQLGLGHNDNRNSFTHVQLPYNIGPIVQVASGYYHTFILDNTGKLFATGHNFYGQLGLWHNHNRNSFTPIGNIPPIKQVACGNYHTFIRYEEGQLFATGLNEYGQLGLRHNDNRNSFTPIRLPDNIGTIAQVVCGGNHTFIRYEEGQLFATGLNSLGQLGLRDYENRNSFTHIPKSGIKGYNKQPVSLQSIIFNHIYLESMEFENENRGWIPEYLQNMGRIPEYLQNWIRLELGHFIPNAIYA